MSSLGVKPRRRAADISDLDPFTGDVKARVPPDGKPLARLHRRRPQRGDKLTRTLASFGPLCGKQVLEARRRPQTRPTGGPRGILAGAVHLALSANQLLARKID